MVGVRGRRPPAEKDIVLEEVSAKVSLRPRRALLGLAAAIAALAALPATAFANFTPALSLNQSAGTTAGSSPATGFNATFTSTTGDTVKDLTLALPPGLLANENIAGGACLASATPNPACQVSAAGSTVTVLNPAPPPATAGIPVTVYLVAPPKPTDIAGLAVVVPGVGTSTADVTLSTSGVSVAFSNLPAGITGMNITLTNLRLPTSCPSPAANVTMTAVSQQGVSAAPVTAPLTVTGCSGLPFAPNLTAAIASDTKGGAEVTLNITQAAGESANKSIVVAFPKGLVPNATPLLPCFTGSTCTIGTATATSPLVPIPLKGAVTLSGSATSPTFAVVFPAPINTTISGTVSLATNSVTFSNMPDIPTTALTLDVTGTSGGRAFMTDCKPASVTGNFTAQGGQTHNVTAPITFTGCQQKPTVSGSTGGLAKGHPKLKFKVVHGKGAPKVSTVTIGLPGGLKFSRSAISSHKTCTKLKNKKKKCTTTTLIKGLGIKGGKAKSVKLKRGRLVITLKKAAGTVTFTLSGPLLSETKGLQTKVKKHKTKKLTFHLKVTDAKKAATSVALKLRAH